MNAGKQTRISLSSRGSNVLLEIIDIISIYFYSDRPI